MFDLVNVFEVFLPQLLLYPNPTDPLNGEAAALLLKQEERYKAKVADYVRRYASEDAAVDADQLDEDNDSDAIDEDTESSSDDDDGGMLEFDDL